MSNVKTLLSRLVDFSLPLIALFLALLVASVMLLALGANPLVAFASMLEGAFGSENAFAETLVKATPIMFVGIGICIASRGGVTNIGGEGQMITGAVAGTAAAIGLADTLGALTAPVALLAGFLAGAAFGGIAGFLKARFNVNEILTTIMLNQVAVQTMNFLLNGVMLDPATAGVNRIPKTARIAEFVELPRLSFVLPSGVELFGRTRLHYGLIIAALLALIVYLLLWRTTIGYRIRAVGSSERAARYAGINVRRYMLLSMLLAGGCAGLAGVVQVLGLQYRLQTDGSSAGFTAAAGFNGIVAALFGGLNPIGTIPASIFFGGLLNGAQKMQRDLGVPASLITAVNGLIVVFVVSSQVFMRWRARRRAMVVAPTPEAKSIPQVEAAS